MQDMSDLRKSIAERLGSAAKSERPGAKAKFSMQFEVGKTYEHSFANDSDARVMWKVMARSGSMLTIKQVASGYRVKTNDPSDYRHGVSAVNGETKRVKIYSDERGEYVYPMGRYSMAPSIRATDIARGFSRPGAKAKFEQAAWMSNVQQFLRNLTAEKQRIRVWIGGPTTVHVAGAWQQHRGPFGLGAAIANRTAYWLQQAARQAGSTASMEGEDRKDQPRKGVTTTIWTVKDIPAEAVAYLKAWGIGTTPQAFAGFTGQSAVAYSRPGAKAKMATEVGRKGNKAAMISRDPNGGWRAWVVQRGSTGVDQYEDVIGAMRSYATEEKAKRAVIAALDTSGFSRPGAKAKMAKWESTLTKKDGKPIEEYTATIHGEQFMIEVKEQAGKPVATLYIFYESRGFRPMGQGTLQAMMNKAQRYAEQEAKDVDAIGRRLGFWSSRPGVKAKMGKDLRELNTYLSSLIRQRDMLVSDIRAWPTEFGTSGASRLAVTWTATK